MPIDRTQFVLTLPEQHTPNTGELVSIDIGMPQRGLKLLAELTFTGRKVVTQDFERNATDREAEAWRVASAAKTKSDGTKGVQLNTLEDVIRYLQFKNPEDFD